MSNQEFVETGEKKNIKAARLKNILEKSLSTTTIHGLNDIYQTNDLFLKIILATCFFASSSFCCYLTAKTFVDFFSFHVLSSNTLISNVPTECNLHLLKHILKLKFIIKTLFFFLKFQWSPSAI
jgi:hypothetical protein